MANKKYAFLDNKPKLVEELKTKSVMQLARQYSEELAAAGVKVSAQVLHGCINHRVKTQFTEDERSQVKRQRGHNKSTSK